jgi:hypothetical protein
VVGMVSKVGDQLYNRLGSLSVVALSLSSFILFILFILGLWVSHMARRLLFQRPFGAF